MFEGDAGAGGGVGVKGKLSKMSSRSLAERMQNAFLQSVAAFLIAGFVGCVGFNLLVRNSQDGQAGMAAAFGAFYLAGLAAVVTFVASLVRSRKSKSLSLKG